MVSVGENGEVLAVGGQMLGETRAGKRVGDGIGREARHSLLAVGHNGSTGCFHPLDRVKTGSILLSCQLFLGDFAGVITGIGRLQLHRSRERAYRLGRDGHAFLLCIKFSLGFPAEQSPANEKYEQTGLYGIHSPLGMTSSQNRATALPRALGSDENPGAAP